MGRVGSRLGLTLAVLAGLALAMPGAGAIQAPTVPAPPEDVQAEPDGGTVTVNWSPPSVNADAVDAYKVYVNGEAVAVTESTNTTLDVEKGGTIWVTSLSADAESAPSTPEIVAPNMGWCVGIDENSTPPVVINYGCDPTGTTFRVTFPR